VGSLRVKGGYQGLVAALIDMEATNLSSRLYWSFFNSVISAAGADLIPKVFGQAVENVKDRVVTTSQKSMVVVRRTCFSLKHQCRSSF
jgi:hypothetical protein